MEVVSVVNLGAFCDARDVTRFRNMYSIVKGESEPLQTIESRVVARLETSAEHARQVVKDVATFMRTLDGKAVGTTMMLMDSAQEGVVKRYVGGIEPCLITCSDATPGNDDYTDCMLQELDLLRREKRLGEYEFRLKTYEIQLKNTELDLKNTELETRSKKIEQQLDEMDTLRDLQLINLSPTLS